MRHIQKLLTVSLLSAVTHSAHAEILQHTELENTALLPGYTNIIDQPFLGIATYANGDGASAEAIVNTAPGTFRLDVRGASSASNSAGISAYLDTRRLGQLSFSGQTPSVQSLEFELDNNSSVEQIRLVLESDTGANDTLLDWFELHRIGDIPEPPPAPVLPSTGSYESGVYRNLFAELGYSNAEIDSKIQSAYDQLFHSPDQQNEALFVPVGSDMAYIWDVGNNDVRSEGMSYGMMMAVQMGRKDDFDRLWKWAHTYSLNKSGDMKGYFAWQVSTSGNVLDKNPAPDGEEYFVTALFFASHLWGDGSGIYDYNAQANSILDDLYSNGQTRYNNQGELETFSLFNHDEMQVVFSPATPSDRNWTDPSYHLPAFYELWARWADNNNQFWADLAVKSREFFKDTAHPVTGLSPDYAYFDGSPHGDFQHWKDTFQYDAWRTIGNAAMDFSWWQNDPWQTTWANRLQAFFEGEGVDAYSSLYELDGTPYENNADHSTGLVAMNAVASLAADDARAWKFVQALWNTEVPSGKWRYYDGSLYMLGMLAVSGKYHVICPAGECEFTPPPSCEQTNSCPTNQAPIAQNDTVTTGFETAIEINALQNDSDADGDTLSIVSVTQASNGQVSQSGSRFTYQPANGFSGQDTFSYTISDGSLSASATVSITVNEPNTTPGGNDGTPVGVFEFELGTISPSYRTPISSPLAGAKLYGNGESVTVSVPPMSAGSYQISIFGASSNSSAAGIALYANGQKLGATDFTGTSVSEKVIAFNLASTATELVFILETDVGQNDTLLDKFELRNGSATDPSDNNPSCEAVTLEAEDYTAFYDTTSGNSGNSYRFDDVDLQVTSDIGGGYNLGWTASGEWLRYNSSLPSGSYNVALRVASQPGGGMLTLRSEGQDISPALSIDSTSGWQNWETLTLNNIALQAETPIELNILSGNFNVNWIKFIPAACGTQ
ncbi:glycosyl hydrolase family 8 [Gilvimarinus polysaccharolyticus]|uniref:glycosyl hydrolase family 8 n=1 Tax=Gilvimarinus polysaccharolyticus TaxID=863921 RepID=UPI0006737DA0|nr:glycosyl hydrolase family 8 [Gilvimarinus polysaccharolyticus]